MTKATSFRLSDEALEKLSDMAAKTGISQAACLEIIIRDAHRSLGQDPSQGPSRSLSPQYWALLDKSLEELKKLKK